MIDIDAELWFPAKDICDTYGLKNARQNVARISEPDEMQQVSRSMVATSCVSFPNRGMLCVNESGAYAMLFRSRRSEAVAFRKWVTGVVLPAIRKDGGYVMGMGSTIEAEHPRIS